MTTVAFVDRAVSLDQETDFAVTLGEPVGWEIDAPVEVLNAGDNRSLVSNDDLRTAAGWLENLYEHRGIDVGPLLRNTFLDMFARELVRQFRLCRRLLSERSVDFAHIRLSHPRVYGWLRFGGTTLHPGIVEAACDAEGVSSRTHTHTPSRVHRRLFRAGGPTALSALDRLSEHYRRSRTTRDSAGGCSLLVYVFTENNLNVLLPVLEGLPDVDVTVVVHGHGFTNFRDDLSDRVSGGNRTVRRFESYQTPSVYSAERTARSRIQARWRDRRDDPSFHDRFRIDGHPIWPGIEDRLWLYHAVQLPRVVRYVETCRRILDVEAPSAVLVKNDGPLPTRTMSTVARNQDTPSVLLQHGIEAPDPRYVPVSAVLAMWGSKWADIHLENGADPDRVEITGAPHFDSLAGYLDADRGSLRADLDLSEGFVVTLATQPFDDQRRERLIRAAVDATAPLSDVTLVLRPHPREDVGLHRTMAEAGHDRIRIRPEADIFELLATSDALLGYQSTVLFEASLLETPVIVLDVFSESEPYQFLLEAFPVATDAGDLRHHLEGLVGDESVRQQYVADQPGFGRRYAHNADGKATQRVRTLLREIATS